MDPRRRLTAAAGAVLLTVLLTACANDPSVYPHGDQSAARQGEDPGGVGVLAVYGIALAIAAVIALLAWLPGMVRGARYRPTQGWNAAPIWFAGPSDPVSALEQAAAGDVTRGGTGGDW